MKLNHVEYVSFWYHRYIFFLLPPSLPPSLHPPRI